MIIICKGDLEGGYVSVCWKNPERTGKLWHVLVHIRAPFPHTAMREHGKWQSCSGSCLAVLALHLNQQASL